MTPKNTSVAADDALPVKIFHVIPEDGIGGVEVVANGAAESLGGLLRVHYLQGHGRGEKRRSPVSYGPAGQALGLRAGIVALRVARTFDPDVIVFSLWKSVLAFLLLRLFLRGRKYILFVHSALSVHMVDRLATAAMVRLCDEVWADSSSSAKGRARQQMLQGKVRVISFVRRKPSAYSSPDPHPVFLYWGRLHFMKRVDEAIRLFSRIADGRSEARFLIAGPDSGSRAGLERLVDELGLGGRIEFLGPMSIDDIEAMVEKGSFYIQLSALEGAAMSVIEAMQFGLVPIVTPVGAITEYCTDGLNSIVFTDQEAAVERIESVLADPGLYRDLRESAMSQWKEKRTYSEDLLRAAMDVSGQRSTRVGNTIGTAEK